MWCVVESTYGDRAHEPIEEAQEQLAAVISRTAARGGTVVIPSFAVDRTEVILLALVRRLVGEKRIPSLPVYADSPMALEVLRVYRRAMAMGDPEIRPESITRDDPFDPGLLARVTHSRAVAGTERPWLPVDHHLGFGNGHGGSGPAPPTAVPPR